MATTMGIMMLLMVAGLYLFGLHGNMMGGHGGEAGQVEEAVADHGGVKVAPAPEPLMETHEGEDAESGRDMVNGDLNDE